MTRREREQVRMAMELLCTDHGFLEAMRILRVLSGGPKETALERAMKNAESVDVTKLVLNQKMKLPEE